MHWRKLSALQLELCPKIPCAQCRSYCLTLCGQPLAQLLLQYRCASVSDVAMNRYMKLKDPVPGLPAGSLYVGTCVDATQWAGHHNK